MIALSLWVGSGFDRRGAEAGTGIPGPADATGREVLGDFHQRDA